ncbi:hypothetical protein RQP46_010608 [Phenoliferia psychrophenolica]
MPVIRKILLDAYGTIFTPRAPLASQYAEIARSVGLKVEESAVKAGFKIAYNTWNASHPIYGKLADPPLDPRSWWANVIKDTFYHAGVAAPLLTQPLLSNLTASLIQRFWTQEGYSLHPDVLPFLTHLTQLGVNNGAAIGSGSEPDVVEILRDLHVISCMKAGDLEHVREDEVFTSWAVGCEKRKEEFWLGVLAKMNEHLEGSEPALRASEVLVIGDELIPCSRECLVEDRKFHKLVCKSVKTKLAEVAKALTGVNVVDDGKVDAIEILSGGDSIRGQPFHAVRIASDDFIFRGGRSDVSPISQVFGLPLLLKIRDNGVNGTPGSDCELATMLMKSPRTGEDPGFPWSSPGTTVMARQDKGKLTVQQAETISAFVAAAISESEADGTPLKEL